MASKDQYEFFRRLYEEEERTSLQLEGRAKAYLGIISAFLVTIFLKTDDAINSASKLKIPFPLLLVEALFFSAALAFVLFALRIREFEAVNDGVRIIEEATNDGPTDEQFFEDRIVDYAFASSRNRQINNETSSALARAAWLLIAGMIFLVVIAILALWVNRK